MSISIPVLVLLTSACNTTFLIHFKLSFCNIPALTRPSNNPLIRILSTSVFLFLTYFVATIVTGYFSTGFIFLHNNFTISFSWDLEVPHT